MHIPEPARTVVELDLMKRLAAYGGGTDSYLPNNHSLGDTAQQACRDLHTMLASLERTVGPLLDKVTAKEMDTFTAHDRRHALKVAHLMWHIISPERQLLLTPAEIGLLVASAFIHDLGMFLSNAEREKRLSPESDLWERLEVETKTRERIANLQKIVANEGVFEKRQRALRQLYQAHEALLCADNRERHATAARYKEIIEELRAFHQKDATNIVDIDAALSFQGDSFLEKLSDICVSHNESAEALVRRDSRNPERPRFPRDYPVGSATADLQFVAATLRMADILDFDRERTPPVLYHYFLPGALDPEVDKSVLEWSKHLAISNWHIGPDEIVFRGRCHNHIVHHGIVHFCNIIAEEISATMATFGTNFSQNPLFVLPSTIKADIHAEGYTYVPYKFELDDERIYRLLMGGAIYDDPLHAIRELIQNAVDACSLRDALTRLNDPGMIPSSEKRIFITYQEPTSNQSYPTLEVQDTGTGMDDWVINRWFLKIGRSFYGSPEFNRFRVDLRRKGLDFAPISEFGIGFLSAFLLADKVEVETAMWEPLRGDTRKRTLEIHGPTRLIRLSDDENTGAARFRGTRVRLTLTRGTPRDNTTLLTWKEVHAYLIRNCVSLPYRLHLRHVESHSVEETCIDPQPLTVDIPESYKAHAVRIPVNELVAGIKGEIALFCPWRERELDREAARESAVRVLENQSSLTLLGDDLDSSLTRGGFRVGPVPGLPRTYMSRMASRAIIALEWKTQRENRYPLTNLARTGLVDDSKIGAEVIRVWLSWLLDHIDDLPEGLMDGFDFPGRDFDIKTAPWLERFDAYTIYRLATNGWYSNLKQGNITPDDIVAWEQSTGKALPKARRRNECEVVLQDLVLPKVCRLQMASEGRYYLAPPTAGWVDVLKNWRKYVSAPIGWGNYVEYIGGIKNLLYYEYVQSDYLNEKYRDRVESVFKEDEIPELIEGLRILADNKQERQIEVSKSTLSLLSLAQDQLGDLEIGELFQTWRIDSFKLPKPQ